MKKRVKLPLLSAILTVAMLLALTACGNDGGEQEESALLSNESAETSASTESNGVQASQEPSEDSLEPSSAAEEVSDTQSGEVPVEPEPTGALFKKYKAMIDTGVYTLTVTELTHIGGESVPRTVSAAYNNGVVHVTVTESNGAVSKMLLKDGAVYTVDDFNRVIYINEYNEETDKPVQLFEGEIKFVGESTLKMYGSTYNCETYEEADGSRFDLLFAGETLERKRVYNDALKDHTVSTVGINEGIDFSLFELPDYNIEDYR